MDAVRAGIKSFLRINEAQQSMIQITETLDYTGNAIKNRIWYRGDSEELSQMYKQIPCDQTRFWSAVPTPGREIRKIHTGLPGIIIETLTDIVISDMNEIVLDGKRADDWKNINKENKFKKVIEKALSETLYIGDGAFKISFDSVLSAYPIIEFYSGDNVEYEYDRGRIKEVLFRTIYIHEKREYVLIERYGKGYITYALTRDGKEMPLNMIPQTENLADVKWNDKFMMALPLKFYDSSKYEGRGCSVFDKKCDAFDSLDEAWSQWMDALRKNRTKEYIPETMIPRNPNTGEPMKPNSFDCAFIKTDAPMTEGYNPKIELVQGDIPHDSYLATYVTALDLCLQGIISPSTLGIDVKKLDNAEAQREKEKATLYTRNKIVSELQEAIPCLIDVVFKAFDTLRMQPVEDTEIDFGFGEYANPSFESQVETVSKAKTGGIMSIEASVEELYGDSKDEEWKKEEVARLKAEQGIVEMEEPSLQSQTGEFGVDTEDKLTTLNGAQISSLMNVISMVKNGTVTRNEGISIVTSTLGIGRDVAETYFEQKL